MTETALAPKTALNQDTGFLKIVAIISMVTDHIGEAFFPTILILRIIGRIAFPIFAYCLVIGCLNTRDIRKYLLRLLVFAIIAQPLYVLNFHDSFVYLRYLNILFTLFFGAIGVYGLMDLRQRWWMLLLCFAACIFLELEYGVYGVAIIIAFYAFRQNRWLSAFAVAVILAIPLLWWAPFVVIGRLSLGVQGFAFLAMPFIYVRTKFNLRINKYFFYAFYPAHIFAIILVEKLLK